MLRRLIRIPHRLHEIAMRAIKTGHGFKRFQAREPTSAFDFKILESAGVSDLGRDPNDEEDEAEHSNKLRA